MHGYTDIYLNGQWVKATPAFDKNLCRFLGIATMEFDGTQDSVFSEFNLDGAKHMEYLKQHGTFNTVPVEKIYQAVYETYPHIVDEVKEKSLESHSLQGDIPA